MYSSSRLQFYFALAYFCRLNNIDLINLEGNDNINKRM